MLIRNHAFLLLAVLLFSRCSHRPAPAEQGHVHKENETPKREFRAAWIASVANIDWPSAKGLPSGVQQQEFINMISALRLNGMNAVMVQVRTASDALYAKSTEPWSEWLSGTQGKAPEPFYDPMEFMIRETHDRNMEFHAWLNLNRGIHKSGKSPLTQGHITRTHPHWFLSYDGYLLFNFGLPEVRSYLLRLVTELVRNYDVDGIHFDDYFYPYTVSGQVLRDGETFRKYGRGFASVEDWRRNNIDLLIRDLGLAISKEKKWVKFGISPFGVWRNRSADPEGSDTRAGQPSYDNMFADTRKWIREGWIDYITPQVYFSFENPLVPYQSTCEWWSKNHGERHLYIGHGLYKADPQSQDRSWKDPAQISRQIRYNRSNPEISGSIWYNTSSLLKNPLGVKDSIAFHYKAPALPPAMPWKDAIPPMPPEKLKVIRKNRTSTEISWTESSSKPADREKAGSFVLYRFDGSGAADFGDPRNILTIIRNGNPLTFTDHTALPGKKYFYAVTALDRLQNESRRSEFVTVK